MDTKLFEFIHSLGFPIGKKGSEIIIPNIFYEKDLMKYIAQGFIATDGSLVLTKNPNKYYPRIEAHAICKNVLKQLHGYFESLGMKGCFYKCKRLKKEAWARRDMYRFQFNGNKNLQIFNQCIGFVNPAYKMKFEKFLKYEQEYSLITRGLASFKVKDLIKNINSNFASTMAAPRFELGTPAL